MEIWVDVLGYQGLYEVSNYGRVKSLKDKYGNERQKILKNHSVNTICSYRQYIRPRVTLYKKQKRKQFLISRLVFQSFCGKIPKGLQIDHINNDPTDNRLQNLQLLTRSENCKKIHKDNPQLRYKKATKIKCLNNNKIYKSQTDAADELHLFSSNINAVLHGKMNTIKGYKFVYVEIEQ